MKSNRESIWLSLGQYVGDYVVRHLPVLSCDGHKTYNIIQVTWGEAKPLVELEQQHSDLVFDRSEESEAKRKQIWEQMQVIRKQLKQKYLPKTTEIIVPFLDLEQIQDMEAFKEGIGDALWDSDISHYECQSADIELKYIGSDNCRSLCVVLQYRESWAITTIEFSWSFGDNIQKMKP